MLRLMVIFLVIFQSCDRPKSLNCEERQKAKTQKMEECFTGTWNLVSNIRKDGDKIIHPFGDDVRGILVYDMHGKMAAQMMKSDRESPLPGYLAYFGDYKINLEKQTVTHIQSGTINPAEVGYKRERIYKFIGNQLHLTPIEQQDRTVIWERITSP